MLTAIIYNIMDTRIVYSELISLFQKVIEYFKNYNVNNYIKIKSSLSNIKQDNYISPLKFRIKFHSVLFRVNPKSVSVPIKKSTFQSETSNPNYSNLGWRWNENLIRIGIFGLNQIVSQFASSRIKNVDLN